MKRIQEHLFLILFTGIALCVLSCGDKKTEALSEPILPQGPTKYQSFIKEAYKFKKTGHNQKALDQFKKAIVHIPTQGTIYASALDDQASVLMRMGKMNEAKKMYQKAIGILEGINGTSLLRDGIKQRLTTLQELEKRGIACNEPGEPSGQSAIPYFPNVPDFQRSLGEMTRHVAECHDSNTIKPITIRVIVTGDGKFVRAYAKDQFAGTKTESCVVQKIKELLPHIELPEFAACFRGFTYPFMIGNHPDTVEPTASDSGAKNDKIPTENALKGTPPGVESAFHGAQKLLNAFQSENPDLAMDFFFPASAFEKVKDSSNPSRYYQKLVQWYKEDIALESPRLRDSAWQVIDVTLGNCKWKKPGTESNRIAYWSCTRNTVTVKADEKQRRFDIQVLINWGKEWYVTHLLPIRK